MRRNIAAALAVALSLTGSSTPAHASTRSAASGHVRVAARPPMGWSSWSSLRGSISAAKIEVPATRPAHVRDLWSHTELGVFQGSFGATVPAHGARLLRLRTPFGG
jgi:hypothetical protein